MGKLLGMNQSAVSHQLRLLKHLRLVKFRRDGNMIYYTCDDERVITLLKQAVHHIEHDSYVSPRYAANPAEAGSGGKTTFVSLLDDLLLVPLGVILTLNMLSEEVLKECQVKAAPFLKSSRNSRHPWKR